MNFDVIFCSGIPDQWVVDVPAERRGVSVLYEALLRSARSVTNISPVVDSVCEKKLVIRIPLEYALELQAETNELYVFVPAGSLNRYVTEKVQCQNGVWKVVRSIDEKSLLSDWRNAGYPIVWNP